jgi:adenylate cyclase
MTPQPWTEADVQRQVARVLASPGFARNDRMSRFLRMLVERRLEGRAAELKESVIAIDVFGRRADYDPRLDSIVRTEAARLRTRLTEYYVGEGRSDALVIDVPKGGYVPVFRQRDSVEDATTPAARRWPVVALVCATVALAIAALWFIREPRAPIRIAVLPLDNLSAEPGSEYFADGLTDEIIRDLSVIDGLEVRSRTSSFAFKGKGRNVRETGKLLDAEYLLEGSVLRSGEQLRINAQLIRARDDVPLWSGQFDRRLTDIFAIQNEISVGIVNNLRLRLGRGRRRYETSVDAYNLYLRASVLAMPGVVSDRALAPDQTPSARFLHSIQSFEAAIRMDASFAPAYAGLAYVDALRSIQFPEAHPADELSSMRAAADKAVQLDPLLPDAHHALAMVYARDGKWELAEQAFVRAIELDPNRSTTYSDYAYWLLAVLGRHADALRQLRAAQKADPLSNDVLFTTALVLISAGRYEDAAAYCNRLPASSLCLARVRDGQGRFEETIELLAHHPDLLQNPQTRGFLGYAQARAGRRDEAQKEAAASAYANEQALIYAGLFDKDRAFAALDRMTILGPQRVGLYLYYPEFALLHDDPRLTAFREKLGLPR